MRTLVVTEFMSLDGVIEAPGGETSLGKKAGWTIPYWDDAIGDYKQQELFAADALVLGRKTYEGFVAAWPTMKDETGYADRMNSMAKCVVASNPPALAWANTTILGSDFPAKIRSLKSEKGLDILVFGSGHLVRELQKHHLIDEYRLLVYPVVLGSGFKLFGEAPDIEALTLRQLRQFNSGVVLLEYTAKQA